MPAPDPKLEAARWLAFLDAAPLDDEPDSDEERAEARAAWEHFKREGGITSQEAKRRLLG
jgi:hypothetical protein